jgi:DNA-binding NarL/FixJ family response regulator
MLGASFEQAFIVADRTSLLEGATRLQPMLVVADLALADGNLGALIAELRGRAPAARTLLLGDHDDPSVGVAALAAGAHGVLSKALLATELYAAIDTLLAGGRYTSTGGPHLITGGSTCAIKTPVRRPGAAPWPPARSAPRWPRLRWPAAASLVTQ